jgi:hypothetical protein
MFYFHPHKLTKQASSERIKKRAMNKSLTRRQLIAGRWVSTGGASFHAVDPATGETLEPPFANARDAD